MVPLHCMEMDDPKGKRRKFQIFIFSQHLQAEQTRWSANRQNKNKSSMNISSLSFPASGLFLPSPSNSSSNNNTDKQLELQSELHNTKAAVYYPFMDPSISVSNLPSEPVNLMATEMWNVTPLSEALFGSIDRQNLSASTVEKNEYAQVAHFILRCKAGNHLSAIEFLRNVASKLTDSCLYLPTEPTSGSLLESDSSNISPLFDGMNFSFLGSKRHDEELLPYDEKCGLEFSLSEQSRTSTEGDESNLTFQSLSGSAPWKSQHIFGHGSLSQLELQLQPGTPTHLPPPSLTVQHVPMYNDETDQCSSTLVMLIPGKSHIVGHLIGKGGVEIGRIEAETGVTIKIESQVQMLFGPTERHVSIVGTVSSNVIAQQYVSMRVQEKLLQEGIQQEILKLVVPNDIVRHLIGKSGSNINRLQSESGARIQVEPQSGATPNSFGRIIVLQGTQLCRSHAQYLIARQMAEDRNIRQDWFNHGNGNSQSPTSTASTSSDGNSSSTAQTGSGAAHHPPVNRNSVARGKKR